MQLSVGSRSGQGEEGGQRRKPVRNGGQVPLRSRCSGAGGSAGANSSADWLSDLRQAHHPSKLQCFICKLGEMSYSQFFPSHLCQ